MNTVIVVLLVGLAAFDAVVTGEHEENEPVLIRNSTCGDQVQNIYIQTIVGDSEQLRGEKGDQGIAGPHGMKGNQGITGPHGMKGNQGIAGPHGAKGTAGMKGITGFQGPRGYPGITGPPGPAGGGATYIRWGRDDCPSTAQLVYNGMAGGSFYNQPGGGNNYLCLPYIPQYLSYRNGANGGRAYVYGAEYQVYDTSAFAGMHDHNVPCAVCHTPTRGAKIMIPARTSCPSSWTQEYYGYLMAGRHDYAHSPPFECVDGNPESIPGTSANTDGALFFFTEARCSGICPPYVDGKELTCAVCTK